MKDSSLCRRLGQPSATASCTLLAASLLAVMPARGAVIDWINPGTGDWSDGGNWLGGVPTSNDSAIIDNGGTARISGPGAAADVTVIGNSSSGSGFLTIDSGGTLTNLNGRIGNATGATGQVTVSGNGSAWTSNGDALYGASGDGTLLIENGGAVINQGGTIAQGIDSTASVTVSGAGSSWISNRNTTVGSGGIGILTVSAGASVSTELNASIGNGSTSIGVATVSGAGSAWNIDGAFSSFFVGLTGNGTLTVSDGGVVNVTHDSTIAQNTGSTGDVTVTDTGSSWTSGGTLTVGRRSNAFLSVRNGADVDSSAGIIGGDSGASGTVAVDGTGSTWTNTNALQVGLDGSATLIIRNGGVVSSTDGSIGENAGSVGTAAVGGAGSVWNNSNALVVGRSGNGDLTVANSGTVNSVGGSVGENTGATGTVLVDGAGSVWTAREVQFDPFLGNVSVGDLFVGRAGSGSMTVTNGGVVESAQGFVGQNGPGDVVISGANSTWDNTSTVTLGNFGDGTLTLADGGRLAASSVRVGENAGSSGTLNIGDGGAAGIVDAGSIQVINGTGTLNFNHTDTDYFFTRDGTGTGSAVDISGNFSVNHLGSGTTTLLGNNTYTGGTTVSAGTLQLGNGGTSGSVSGNVAVNGGTLAFNRSDDLTLSGQISGAGGLRQLGAGRLTLSGNNSFSGGVTVVAGTLRLGADTAAGTGAITARGGAIEHLGNRTIANDIVLDAASTQYLVGVGTSSVQAGDISETGGSRSLEKTGVGVLTLLGDNSYTGTTVISNGTLNLGDAGNQTRLQGSIENNAFLNIRNADLSGVGTLINTGDLSFDNDSSAAAMSITHLNPGTTFRFFGTSSAGDATILNDSEVQFVGNSTAGNAAITNNANGRVDFSTSTGPLGDGLLSAGSIAGAGEFFLGDTTLTVGGNNASTEVSGVISDCGATGFSCGAFTAGGTLVKTGAGTLTLSGANSYTGGTRIDGGLLVVNGSVAAPTTVNAGATLGGSGTLGDVTVNSGGTLAPGNSPGILTIAGDLSLTPGSVTVMEIDGPAPGTGHDQVNVSGTATLDGTLQLDFGFAPTEGDSFNLINAGSIVRAGDAETGFAAITSNLGETLLATTVIDPTTFDILVELAQQSFVETVGADLTPNQRQVAAGLDQFSTSGQAADLIGALNMLSAQELPAAIGSLTGEQHTHMQTLAFQVSREFQRLLSARLGGDAAALAGQDNLMLAAYEGAAGSDAGRAGLYAEGRPARGWWVRGHGGFGDIDDTDSVEGADYHSAGLVIGADTRLVNQLVAGAAVGYTRTDADTAAGNLDVDSYLLAGYGGWQDRNVYLRGTAGLAYHDTAANRRVAFGGFDRTAEADYEGWTATASAEGGRAYALEGFTATPFIGLEYTHLRRDGFTESGAGGANLRVDSERQDSLRSVLGARLMFAPRAIRGLQVSPAIEAAWVHEYLDDDARIDVGFAATTASDFRIRGPELDRDRARLGAGLVAQLARNTRLRVGYLGEIAGSDDHHAFNATLQMKW